MQTPGPSTLGLRKSFGYGDRLGLATAGHLAASRKFDFAPIFAQQSIREMARTQRTPEEVMSAAVQALQQAGYAQPWGADADHLKTPEDARRTAAAGFCFFTIDPSEFVNNLADQMTGADLAAGVDALERTGTFPGSGWKDSYLKQTFDIGGRSLVFSHETLFRAAVKYARAVAHAAHVGEAIAAASAGRPFEIEVSVDETDSPTSALEHLFFGLELNRRRVPNVVSLAPRFIGEFEKGIDYKGDLKAFEQSLIEHVAIAKFCGPYKISIHSGSDKFSAYPVIGRVCGDLLHVKTAGTSYLEALRVISRTQHALFAEIAAYCRGRFDTDRKSYHISTATTQIESLRPFTGGPADEALYLDEVIGRQLLHVTFGSVISLGTDAKGRRFKDGILHTLIQQADLHSELLDKHFTKHLSLLSQG